MRFMKSFVVASFMAVACLCFTGCSDSNSSPDPVDVAKAFVFDVDKTRNLEDALMYNLDDLRWREYCNEYNQQVVEVTGVWKRDGVQSESGHFPHRKVTIYVIQDCEVEIKIILNKDNTMASLEFKARTKDDGRLGLIKYYGDDIDVDGSDLKNEYTISGQEALDVIFFMHKK